MRKHDGYTHYIWQTADWPNFTWDLNKLLGPLTSINKKQGQLNGIMSLLGFEKNENAQLEALTDELVSSSQIEGVQINPKSVRSSIGRRLGIEGEVLLSTDHYVEGLVDILMDALNIRNEPLTSEKLFAWHSALFPTGRSGIYPITVGGWRTGEAPMQIVSGPMGKEKVHYQAPASKDVSDEMLKLLDWINTVDLHPIIVAGIAHLWFVTIHPFDDGNGRLCRTVTDMLLCRDDGYNCRYYSMSAEINQRKNEYYGILENTQKGNLDITEWLYWFCSVLEQAIDSALIKVSKSLEKARYWDRFRNEMINARQRKIINKLWDDFEGKLTSSKWAKICRCSQDTAHRDIVDLIRRGMLKDSGEGGRSKNYLLNTD